MKLHTKARTAFVLAASLLVVDQLVKWWARGAAEGVEGRVFWPIWPNVFELKLVYNEGIAFGMLQGMGVWLAPIAIVITWFALRYSYKHPQEPMLMHVTMGLLASGAVGNLIDRLVAGRVTDMFWIRAIDFPVFNIADICITIAGVLLVFGALREVVPKKKSAESAGS